jgi:SPP1 gp7 family putative phage head morphogenesis protein
VTERNTPAIRSALRALVPDVTSLAAKLVDQQGKVKSLVKAGMADPDPGALENLYRDAWQTGQTAARALVDVSKADAGTPTVLDSLLALAGEIWQAIAGWTSDRIATVVTEALTSGEHADVRSIAQQINEIVDDPDRAHMIAQTETTRAMTGAAMATYREFGTEQIEFLTADDDHVDELCGQNEDHGPVPIDHTDQLPHGLPPVHPRCRCTVVPA